LLPNLFLHGQNAELQAYTYALCSEETQIAVLLYGFYGLIADGGIQPGFERPLRVASRRTAAVQQLRGLEVCSRPKADID
jgi:hypothetical protein